MATVMTDKDEIIKRQLATVAEVAKKFPIIKGIHLEGPFLSAEYKGAMPLSLLQIPSAEKFDEYQKCAGGLIKLITIAPELPHAAEVIKHIAKTGVAVSLGHSGASFTETMTAIKCGAKSFTHLFNAMRPIHHHTPSIIVAGLYSDNYCETIVDGKHLNCDIVRTIAKIKGDKMIAITDSLMCAGLPNGEYRLAGTPIEVVDGDCWIKGTNTRCRKHSYGNTGLAQCYEILQLHFATINKFLYRQPCAYVVNVRQGGQSRKRQTCRFYCSGRQQQIA